MIATISFPFRHVHVQHALTEVIHRLPSEQSKHRWLSVCSESNPFKSLKGHIPGDARRREPHKSRCLLDFTRLEAADNDCMILQATAHRRVLNSVIEQLSPDKTET